MLREDGMLMDDGVMARLGEQHFYLTTTTGGAANVLAWLEKWLQTEWPDLEVYLTSLTEQYSTIAIAGPKSRAVLQNAGCNIALDQDSFPFMTVRQAEIGGIPIQLFRVSFSGELAYEVNVDSRHAAAMWRSSTGSPGGPSLLRLALTGDRHEEARRWLLWELHGSYARLVIPDLIGIYADGWWTRPGRINPGETYHGGRGGEVGLEARPAWPPLALRFGYAIDEIRIGSQGRRETVERVTLTIGYTIGGGSREAAAAARTGSSQFD
jgi:hypothetical protein